MESLPNYKMRIREQHAAAFELHQDVAVAFERAVLTPRGHAGALALAADVLMLHGYKAHGSVRLLAECGHLEDAAAVALRLTGLADRLAAIVSHEDRAVSERDAAAFLADVWSGISDGERTELPDPVRARWEAIREQAGALSALTPSFATEVGAERRTSAADERARDEDLLHELVRGATAEQVLHASQPAMDARLARHVGAVLVAASRGYLALAEQWNRVLGLVDKQAFESLWHRARRWKPGH